MSAIVPTIFQAEYNEEDIKNVVFENTAKMIANRKNLDYKPMFEDFKNNFDNDSTWFRSGEIKIALKLLQRKITTIRKVEDIEEFLDKYKDHYKFIIVSKITPKAYKQFIEYDNLEVFFDEDLLVNKIDHIFVPKTIVLTNEEKEQLEREYGFKRIEIGIIKQSDPIARYYNLQPGQIIKIERPSDNSGITTYFRKCVAAPLI